MDKRRIYNIDLEKGKMSSFYLIYPLVIKELIVLQKYLQTMFEKRWIRFSNSLIKAPIIFVLRKDNKLKLYIDYQRLNKIIKKLSDTNTIISNI